MPLLTIIIFRWLAALIPSFDGPLGSPVAPTPPEEEVYVCHEIQSAPRLWGRLNLVLLTSALFLFVSNQRALGQSTNADPQRKVKVAAKPEYSALAKRLNLSGLVRVEVLIGTDGKVKRAHVLGGHPVLALEAEKAAIMTEFEPGPKESTQVLEFHFGSES